APAPPSSRGGRSRLRAPCPGGEGREDPGSCEPGSSHDLQCDVRRRRYSKASAPAATATPTPAPSATPSLCACAARFGGAVAGKPACTSICFTLAVPRNQPPTVDCVPQNVCPRDM